MTRGGSWRRLRQGVMDRRRGRLCRGLSRAWSARRRRTITLRQRRPCLVLLLGTRGRVSGTPDGLLSHHRDDESPPSAEHGVVRSPFPNQDTLPKGGFGNLIALPLQHGPRQLGEHGLRRQPVRATPIQLKTAITTAGHITPKSPLAKRA